MVWPGPAAVAPKGLKALSVGSLTPNAPVESGSGASCVDDLRFRNEPWKYARAEFVRWKSPLVKSENRCDGVIR